MPCRVLDNVISFEQCDPATRSSVMGLGPLSFCLIRAGECNHPARYMIFLQNRLFLSLRALPCPDQVSGSAAGDTSSSEQLGDGSGSRGSNIGLFSAIRQAGIPMVMVQSTEDALIGSPLALMMKQEVGLCRRVAGKRIPSLYPLFAAIPGSIISRVSI